MKLTENQKILVNVLLRQHPLLELLRLWKQKEERDLVVDEILLLAKKLNVKFTKEQVKRMREVASSDK